MEDLGILAQDRGILAQDRGNHEEAEARYRQSLDINERLGNLAGMATSWSQIGQMSTPRGDPRAAVAWHIRALAVRLRLGSPQVAITLSRACLMYCRASSASPSAVP